jgi:PQQ-like domain
MAIVVLSATPSERQLWVHRYDGPSRSYDYGISTAVSPDGTTLYVAGSSDGGGTSLDYVTIAYDESTGETEWVSRYDRPTGAYDEAIAMAISPDGTRLFVTGFSDPTDASPDFATVAYDARTGAELWTAIYDGGYDLAIAIATSADGSEVFVTGVGGTGSYPTTAAYDAATGEQLWVDEVPQQGDGFAVAASPDSERVYVTGTCVCGHGEDFLTVAYDASTGTEVWKAIYDGPSHAQDVAVDLAVSPDGRRLFVTGQSADSQGYGYATIAYDALSGRAAWLATFHGPGGGVGFAKALGVSPDGTMVYVTGNLAPPPHRLERYATVAYDADTGAKRWVSMYKGPGTGNDGANALVVSPTGDRVYVTGHATVRRQSEGYGTVAIDAASGATMWSALYTGPDTQSDEAYAIAVTPDGRRVFVTGRSYGPNDADSATVAYGA